MQLSNCKGYFLIKHWKGDEHDSTSGWLVVFKTIFQLLVVFTKQLEMQNAVGEFLSISWLPMVFSIFKIKNDEKYLLFSLLW